ncbi:MAG TPA: hypothetical protein VFQ53_15910 [Kofleriaceae bacterium]|nr:hypothetical protein [Kofleriaceae bacterium]
MLAELEAHLATAADDDPAWDVYGDHLIERGEPRGQLVQLERELAAHRDPAIEAQLAELVAAHQSSWRGAIPEAAATRWRHGFVVELSLPFDGALAATARTLLASPEARFVRSLRIVADRYERGPHDIVRELLETVDLRRLRAFACPYCQLGFDIAHWLIAAALPLLEELDLRHNTLENTGIAMLSHAPQLGRLRVLSLQRNQIRSGGAKALAASPHLRQLERLDLRWNRIGERGAYELAMSPNVARLSALYLHHADVGSAGAEALARSPQLPPGLRRVWRAR